MHPVLFARALRARGCRYMRSKRGVALFALREPDGASALCCVTVHEIAGCQADLPKLIEKDLRWQIARLRGRGRPR